MKTNLKPCPFCGGKAKLMSATWQEEIYTIYCCDCECELESLDEVELIKRWNTRHDEMTIKKTLLLIVNIAVYSVVLAIVAALVWNFYQSFQ